MDSLLVDLVRVVHVVLLVGHVETHFPNPIVHIVVVDEHHSSPIFKLVAFGKGPVETLRQGGVRADMTDNL